MSLTEISVSRPRALKQSKVLPFLNALTAGQRESPRHPATVVFITRLHLSEGTRHLKESGRET